MATEIEYEKTYLAKSLPEGLEDAKSVLIHDVYIPESAGHAHLRLRRKDDTYVITKKHPVTEGDSSMQYEHTIELEKEEWEALAACSKKEFVKRRYFMKIDGHDAEVDVFEEKLAGLVTIDFEFSSEAEKETFSMLSICLADVTQEEFVAGGYVSGKSYEDIEPNLRKYNYKRIEV